MTIWNTTGPHSYSVYDDPYMNGGGTWFGQEYKNVIVSRYARKFQRCLEWCSGPGYIGFDLLDYGICSNLALIDSYEPAINNVAFSVRDNQLENKVNYFLGNTIDCIDKKLKFDLVVGNPPHYNKVIRENNNDDRLDCDPNWDSHKNFFKSIGSYLTDDGVILLQENWLGTNPDTFKEMIEQTDLMINAWWTSPLWFHGEDFAIYYLEVKKK